MYHHKKIKRKFKVFMRKFGYFRPSYAEVSEFTHLLKSKNNNQSKYGLSTEVYDIEELTLNSSHIMLYREQQEKEGKQ